MKYRADSILDNTFHVVVAISYYYLLTNYGDYFMERIKTLVLIDNEYNVLNFSMYFFVTYFLTFWIISIPYLLLSYFEKPAFLYKYKIQKYDQAKDIGYLHIIGVVLRNMFFASFPMLLLFSYAMQNSNVLILEPSILRSFVLLIIWIISADISFYFGHRMGHHPKLYGSFHKMHHKLKAPICIGTHYASYLDHLLVTIPEIIIGPLLTYSYTDIYTIEIWKFLGIFHALHSHSGFDFPFVTSTLDHEFHHFNFKGNYGNLGLCDYLFGTDKEFIEYKNKLKIEYNRKNS